MKKSFNKKFGLSISCVMTAALLAACGGGGGGSADAGNSGSGSGSGTGGPVAPPVITLKAELLAGQPGGGAYLDGQGNMARFYSLKGVVSDSKGNTFLLDERTIRKVTPDGTVSLYAGKPFTRGNQDGPVSEARFSDTLAMTIDASDNIYVADGQMLRKITPQGVVSTMFKLPEGYGKSQTDGLYTNVYQSKDIVVDSKGNFYLFAGGSLNVYKISPTGTVETIASSTRFIDNVSPIYSPYFFDVVQALAIDKNDNLYIWDGRNDVVVRYGQDKQLHIFTQGILGTPATRSYLPNTTASMGVDKNGQLFVSNGAVLKKADLNQVPVVVMGDPVKFGVQDGSMLAATGVRWQKMTWNIAGEMLIIDKNALRKVDANGWVTTLAGKNVVPYSNRTQTTVSYPYWLNDLVVTADQSIYIADYAMVRKVNLNNKSFDLFAGAGEIGYQNGKKGLALFDQAIFMTADNAGNLFVSDTFNRYIRKVDTTGTVTTIAGTGTQTGLPEEKSISDPGPIHFTRDGRLVVTDAAKVIRQVNADGSFTTITGKNNADPLVDGTASTARFGLISGLTSDSKGNLYAVDGTTYASGLRKISKDGAVSFHTGSYTQSGVDDGPLNDARFTCISGVTSDDKDNLYIADYCANAIRKVSTDGKVSTLKLEWTDRDGRLYRVIPGPTYLAWAAGKLYVHGDGVGTMYGAIFQIPLN